MKLFKTHFSVIFSLFVLLCSLQFIIFTNKIIVEYEGHLSDDYSIIAAANEPLNTEELIRENPTIKSIKEISSSSVLNRLKDDLPLSNIELLQRSMPKFYNIKLNRFPSTVVSNSLKNSLLKNRSITKVEIFAKTYNKIYQILKLLNIIVYVFMAFSALMALLLISKQVRLWIYEHSERLYVMELFGASFWTKNGVLYKSAFVNSTISCFLAVGAFFGAEKSPYIQGIFMELSINIPKFDLYEDSVVLLSASLTISILSTILALLMVKRI